MKYFVFPHCVKIENNSGVTYGIVAMNGVVPAKIVKDVSTEYKTVRKLVKKLNLGHIELVHLDDIIEDFFFENI